MARSDLPYRYHEGRFKRWVRMRFASEEARMDLPKSRAENAVIGMRVAYAIALWITASMLSTANGAVLLVVLAYVLMAGMVAWTALTDFASDWERERLLSKRAEDRAEHKDAIAKGKAIFNDVTGDVEERTAALEIVKGLKAIAKADDDAFDEAVRQELFGDE